MKSKQVMQGISGAFACGYCWLMSLYLIGLLNKSGASGTTLLSLLGSFISITLMAIFFALGYTPVWVLLGLLAAWRVPHLARRASWLRVWSEGAALGLLFMFIFSMVIAYGFYHNGQYRHATDLAGRFAENFFAFQTPVALIIFTAWLHQWCRYVRSTAEYEK